MPQNRTSRILIVEDERITALDIRTRLVKLGYSVCATVSSAEEAITSAGMLHPDLVLMDIVLKGSLDGVEAAGRIRSQFNVPVVYLTAFSDPATVQRAKLTEPFGYVLKPFEERDLRTTIEMALYKHGMEEKLKESEREKTIILNSTADVILYHDPDLKIRWANRTAGRALQENPEALRGRYCYEIWPQRNSPCEGCPVVEARETGQDRSGEVTSRDGRSWYVRAFPVRDDAGRVTAIAEFSLDITEQKKAEEQVRKLSHAVEQSPAVIMITDKEGNIDYVNPRFTHVTGYTFEEVKGKNPRFLKSGRMQPEEYKKLWDALASGKEWRGEMQNKKKNGQLFWEFASISPIVGPDGSTTHFLAVKEDITQRKYLERQVMQAQKMESIGTMVGGISHDFNNILNNVIGFVYQMRKYSHDPVKIGRYVDLVEKSAARGADLANQLLALVRRKKQDDAPLDVSALVDEVVGLIGETLPENISILTTIASRPLTIMGNHGELFQAVLNVCLNAREAMPQGGSMTLEAGIRIVGGEIDAAIVPSPLKPGQHCAYIQIRDSGTGIREDDRIRIFDPFFSTKDRGRGTGLGLSVAYNVIKNHKGTILLDSVEGVGSTFTLCLPLPVEDHTVRQPEGADVPEHVVLLVDDELAMIELGRELLEGEGYGVLTASDGLQALELYRNRWKDIDLVVLDLVMPMLDGGQAFLEMKKINPDIRAFFCTGYSPDRVITSLLAEENLSAMQKPFRPKEFVRLVKEMLPR